jgi:hypothetical protein
MLLGIFEFDGLAPVIPGYSFLTIQAATPKIDD